VRRADRHVLDSLTNEQLIAEYKQGNREAYDLLFERNERLFWHIAKPFIARWYYLKDDIVQEGMMGAMKIVERFDFEKGAKFATACVRPVRNNILMFLRRERVLRYNSEKQQKETGEKITYFTDSLSLSTELTEEGAVLEDILPSSELAFDQEMV